MDGIGNAKNVEATTTAQFPIRYWSEVYVYTVHLGR